MNIRNCFTLIPAIARATLSAGGRAKGEFLSQTGIAVDLPTPLALVLRPPPDVGAAACNAVQRFSENQANDPVPSAEHQGELPCLAQPGGDTPRQMNGIDQANSPIFPGESKGQWPRLPTLSAIWLLASTLTQAEPEARFFRVAGPVPVTITTFSLDGYLTWTSALTDGVFTIQTTTSLLGKSNWEDFVRFPAPNGSGTVRVFDLNLPAGMALIPAGTFQMGDTFNDSPGGERSVHSVFVSAFYMDKYEVTKALWDEVEAWSAGNGYDLNNVGAGKDANHPVQKVSWYDVVKWCNARSQQEGRVPAYYTDASLTQVYKTGQKAPYVKWAAGYRLPTEAEWEKAARGGVSGHRFPWSNSDTISHSRANYYSHTAYAYDEVDPTGGYHPTYMVGQTPYTSPVGSFAPNGYGLYDMAGNVNEWCWDWNGPYSSGSQSDPRGPGSGSSRVIRGGSWYVVANNCRSAFRFDYPSDFRNFISGFRSVLPPGQP